MTRFNRLSIPDVIEIVPQKFGDDRGFLSEVWQHDSFSEQGVANRWIQENHSYSREKGTVRGLHFQVPPTAQAKLVRVLRGEIFDVALDLRQGSPDYGKWAGVSLSADRWNQLYLPQGFAHGFMTLTEDVEVLYKLDAPYSPEDERAIAWDDPSIGIDWPDPGVAPIHSQKDRAAAAFADLKTPFEYRTG